MEHLMEPSRRNQWQSAANGRLPKPPKEARSVAVRCHVLPESSNGKEGVGGFESARGLGKRLEMTILRRLVLPELAR
jgi:hypothetical protein